MKTAAQRRSQRNNQGRILILTGVFAVLVLAAPTASGQSFKMIGPSGCGTGQVKCHTSENDWWSRDKHFRSAQPFIDLNPDYVALMRKMGLDPENNQAINKSCMGCHATVVGGAEADLVEDGVSCESCHGPGSGYKDAHQDKDYQKGLSTGLKDMRSGPARAAACVACHLTVDQKLLRAGHPEGWKSENKYVTEMRPVSAHWGDKTKGRALGSSPADKDPAPFAAAIQARLPTGGGLPAGEIAAVARPAVSNAGPATAPAEDPPAGASTAPGVGNGGASSAPDPNGPRAFPEAVDLTAVPVPLLLPVAMDSFPVFGDSTTAAQMLSTLKLRLDRLFVRIRAAYAGNR